MIYVTSKYFRPPAIAQSIVFAYEVHSDHVDNGSERIPNAKYVQLIDIMYLFFPK